MAAGAFSAARRRNVSPVSSTLSVQTRDVDCSGLAASPEDGEFVTQQGTNPSDANNVYHGAALTNVTVDHDVASSLTMVWGSAQSSDRQALGDTRVATLAHGGIDIDCAIYIAPDDTKALNHADNFPVGALVSVAVNASDSVEGAITRLLLNPMANQTCGWAVGYVTRSPSQNPAADRAIGVYLYDKPQWIAKSA